MTDHTKALTRAADALENARRARDAAIIAAHNAGTSTTAIAAAVRMSRMQVHRIITAHNTENAPSLHSKE